MGDTTAIAYENKPNWLYGRKEMNPKEPILSVYMDCAPITENLRVEYSTPAFQEIKFESGAYESFPISGIVGYIPKAGAMSPRRSPPLLNIRFSDMAAFVFPGSTPPALVKTLRTSQDIASDRGILTKYYFHIPGGGDRGDLVIHFLDNPTF